VMALLFVSQPAMGSVRDTSAATSQTASAIAKYNPVELQAVRVSFGAVAPALTASEALSLRRAIMLACGIATCTVYLTKAQVQSVWRVLHRYSHVISASISGAFALACAPLGGIGAVVCAVAGAVLANFAIDQFEAAASGRACIGVKVQAPMRVVGLGPVPTGAHCR